MDGPATPAQKVRKLNSKLNIIESKIKIPFFCQHICSARKKLQRPYKVCILMTSTKSEPFKTCSPVHASVNYCHKRTNGDICLNFRQKHWKSLRAGRY